MSFTHNDFYHAPATLKRVAAHLMDEGYINEQEHYRIFECISAAGLMGVDKQAADELANYVRDTPANRKHLAIQKVARDVVNALGGIIAATSNADKKEAIRTILTFLAGGGHVSEAKLSPPKKNRTYQHNFDTNSNIKQVIFSDLPENEKEDYYSFLVKNNVQFYREADGSYVANVRLEPPGSAGAKALREEKEAKKRRAKAARRRGGNMYGRRASRPPAEMARIVGAMAGGGKRGDFDFEAYPKFSSLITLRDQLKPRKRPLSWIMRLIEEIYDARFIHDSADFKDDGTVVEKGERLSNLFPVFVVDFFSKRYGLRKLVDQTCWDLLFNTHAMRKEHLEVEVFARFLEEFYDPDDLLFFLYVRSVVQKEIGINFRNRWNELGRGRERLRETVWLSYRSCVQVSRVVFVSESDPLFRAFMDMIERHLVGAVTRKSDTRRIEVMQFLHLALAEYHETRPAEGEEATAHAVHAAESEAGEYSMGAGGQILVHSKEEQDRLFKEAERQYESSMSNSGSRGAFHPTAESASDRQQRIKEMEERIREEIAARRAAGEVGGTSDASQRNALRRSMEAVDQDQKLMDHVRDVAPPAPPGGDRARKDLLIEMSQRMHVVTTNYLDQLMESCQEKNLPGEIVEEIRREVQLQLEAKVEQMLEAVVDASYASNAESSDTLVNSFKSVISMRVGRERSSGIGRFCDAVLQSPALREEIEPLVALLTTFALSNLKKKEVGGGGYSGGGGGRGGANVHVSRTGSVDIEINKRQ